MIASRAIERTAQATSQPVSPPPTMATRSASRMSRRTAMASPMLCMRCMPGSSSGQPLGRLAVPPVAMTSPS